MTPENTLQYNGHIKHRHLTLGLFGFGCVGQGLYHVLNKTQGIKAEIKKICVKNRNKTRSLPEGIFTFEKDDVLNDPGIDVVVELRSEEHTSELQSQSNL